MECEIVEPSTVTHYRYYSQDLISIPLEPLRSPRRQLRLKASKTRRVPQRMQEDVQLRRVRVGVQREVAVRAVERLGGAWVVGYLDLFLGGNGGGEGEGLGHGELWWVG